MVVMPVETVPVLPVKRILVRIDSKGFLEAEFALEADIPDKEFKNHVQFYEIQLTEMYSVAFRFWPNGMRKGDPAALMITPQRDDGKDIYVKFHISLLAANGSVWSSYKDPGFIDLEFGVSWIMTLCNLRAVIENSQFFIPKRSVRCVLKLTINTVTTPPPALRNSAPIEITTLIKDKIHQPFFGDIEILARGAKLRAHRSVLMRHRVFRLTLIATKEVNPCIPMANTYPEVIEKLLIEAYLAVGNGELRKLLS